RALGTFAALEVGERHLKALPESTELDALDADRGRRGCAAADGLSEVLVQVLAHPARMREVAIGPAECVGADERVCGGCAFPELCAFLGECHKQGWVSGRARGRVRQPRAREGTGTRSGPWLRPP